MTLRRVVAAFVVLAGVSCAADHTVRDLDTDSMLADLQRLSADAMNGRLAGTPGNEAARQYIITRFRDVGLSSEAGGYEAAFDGGVNVVGHVTGRELPDQIIVVTAHFDHLGECGGEICNGADDNASGTAALVALADYLVRNPLRRTIVFAALDAEEGGLRGAHAFLADSSTSQERIVLNVNMDMISHNDRTLYAAGGYHYPHIQELLVPVAERAPVELLFGHDRPELGVNDWTNSSDHGPFHAAGIPFVYFGVEDHEDYHQPTDEFARINQDFYVNAVATILDALVTLDGAL